MTGLVAVKSFYNINTIRFEWNSFHTAEHGGTHIDAPSHFVKGQWRVHQIPIERLVGTGVIINVEVRTN